MTAGVKRVLRQDLEGVCPIRARAVLDKLERDGSLAAALDCLRAAEEDLLFFYRQGLPTAWPETLHCLYFARRLLEEELAQC